MDSLNVIGLLASCKSTKLLYYIGHFCLSPMTVALPDRQFPAGGPLDCVRCRGGWSGLQDS